MLFEDCFTKALFFNIFLLEVASGATIFNSFIGSSIARPDVSLTKRVHRQCKKMKYNQAF